MGLGHPGCFSRQYSWAWLPPCEPHDLYSNAGHLGAESQLARLQQERSDWVVGIPSLTDIAIIGSLPD